MASCVVRTPGHSDDSVSLLRDDGAVFTGDLTMTALVTEEAAPFAGDSRAGLKARSTTRVCPGHGPVWPLP